MSNVKFFGSQTILIQSWWCLVFSFLLLQRPNTNENGARKKTHWIDVYYVWWARLTSIFLRVLRVCVSVNVAMAYRVGQPDFNKKTLLIRRSWEWRIYLFFYYSRQLRLSSGGQNHLSVTTTTLIHSFLAIVVWWMQQVCYSWRFFFSFACRPLIFFFFVLFLK